MIKQYQPTPPPPPWEGGKEGRREEKREGGKERGRKERRKTFFIFMVQRYKLWLCAIFSPWVDLTQNDSNIMATKRRGN